MNIFIILPNQLFEYNYDFLKGFNEVFIIEEPYYFSSIIKPNKIKIAYMRACMKYYYDDLKNNNINVIYINFEEINNYHFIINKLKNDNILMIYEINDYKLKNKYNSLNINFIEVETPMFIMKKIDLDLYDRKTPTHSSFYEIAKKKLKILEGIKNQDIYNRSNPKNTININLNINYINNITEKYYYEGINYANKKIFNNHIGNPNIDNLKIFPITSIDAYKAFDYFLENNLKHFGIYQDIIQDNNPFIYHSIISPMLNIGLLNPLKLINKLKDYKSKVPLNSYEGFIRQLIGWREYMRYLYLYKYNDLISSNNHNNYKNIDNKWYLANTGILVIDNEIKKAINYGYAHHIVRLMIFLNFLILNEINPKDIYKWFMEVISMDAYDWIMIPNIYSMGHFSSIGMKRPYLSSSNYILKMSNYKKNGKWDIYWSNKFRDFVKSRKINFYLRSIK